MWALEEALPEGTKSIISTDLFKIINKTGYQIFLFLAMQGKLSLTELSNSLKRSKSTLSVHLKKLKDI